MEAEAKEKVYISGAMTGHTRRDIRKRFGGAERYLKKSGYCPLNPDRLTRAVPPLDYEDYMKLDLVYLDIADAICMTEGWTSSRGALREFNHAVETGKRIYILKGKQLLDYGILNAVQKSEVTENEYSKRNA